MRTTPVKHEERCLECGHPFSAMSAEAVALARLDHADHVNAHGDRVTDDHFALIRLNALLAYHPGIRA